MKIQGQHFLITGANRGIGRAVVLMGARRKAHLHLVMRAADPALVAELKEVGAASVQFWPADLASRQGVEKLLSDLGQTSVDILFNNAGQLTGGLIEEQPLDDIYSMFQVNVQAVVHLTRGLLPGMIKRGRGKVVNNASVSAIMHFPCASTYAASKAAVVAFTDCIQLELQGTGVSTLCLITPGIKTRMFDEIDVKYSKNLEVPKDSISTDEYAELIGQAIERDDTYFNPTGATGMGLFVARHLPRLFQRAVARKFHR